MNGVVHVEKLLPDLTDERQKEVCQTLFDASEDGPVILLRDGDRVVGAFLNQGQFNDLLFRLLVAKLNAKE